jgi:hypothetical protein
MGNIGNQQLRAGGEEQAGTKQIYASFLLAGNVLALASVFAGHRSSLEFLINN